MTSKSTLFAGAAIALTLAAATTAEAKTAPKSAAAARQDAQAAEIEALRQQIKVLTDRLDAQEAAQRQAQQQAAQAQQVAQASQAAAQSAQAAAQSAQAAQVQADAAVKQIPAQVKTEVAAATPKPKPSWADNTSISGRMYFNASNIDLKRDGSKIAPSGTGFEIKRFYLGVDHKFNDVYSGNLTTDVNYVANDGETQVYIKKAYLQAKYSDALTVRLGSADLPWVPFAEDIYGYRFIENVLVDRTKFGTSADWGVHAAGKLADGHVSYAVAVVDGAGYKAPLRSNGVDVEGRISATFGDFTAAVGGYSGKLGKDNVGALTPHTANRFDALAAYTTKRFRLGAEYFDASNWNNVLTTAKDSANGYSLFGSASLTDQISAFARYDWVKPSADLNPRLKDRYFNIGLDYQPTKIVDLALVYKRDQIDGGTLSTSNGAIGGVDKGTYDEFGLFGQFRW